MKKKIMDWTLYINIIHIISYYSNKGRIILVSMFIVKVKMKEGIFVQNKKLKKFTPCFQTTIIKFSWAKIEASLFGCIAIFSTLSYLSVVISGHRWLVPGQNPSV